MVDGWRGSPDGLSNFSTSYVQLKKKVMCACWLMLQICNIVKPTSPPTILITKDITKSAGQVGWLLTLLSISGWNILTYFVACKETSIWFIHTIEGLLSKLGLKSPTLTEFPHG